MDPGTTSSYAILDVNGNTIKTRSARQLDINTMLSEISSEGTAIAIGTDKKNCPSIIQKFSSKTGAKIISPHEDLAIREKLELTKGKEYRNEHERDALACAIKAYKELQPLLWKIDKTLKQSEKMHLREKVTRLVITKKTSINNAIERLSETPKIEEKIKQPVKPTNNKKTDTDKILSLKRTNQILKIQNTELKKALSAKQRAIKPKPRKDIILDSLWRVIRDYKAANTKLQESITITNKMISLANGKFILKKLGNLGSEEYSKKQFEINQGDIILVEDPNIISQSTIERIRGKVQLIIHKMPTNSGISEKIGIRMISSERLRLLENDFFALADPNELEREKARGDLLSNIIESYRKERTAQ
ncbi:DUF460 domain-containing protein [Candidatus Woesearchaeota archaeon]|nr:DUF460 domain-containing protein [Candidatus Woesearchaeota archaeon]